MNEKRFELGERRRVTMAVWMNDGAAFTPTDCRYTLMLKNGVEEASGPCEAAQDGNRWLLSCEVQPQKRYEYRLQYSFALGTEIIKRSVDIKVV